MIILGIVLLAIGYLAHVRLAVTAGWVVLVIGLILWILSATTSPICGGAYGCY